MSKNLCMSLHMCCVQSNSSGSCYVECFLQAFRRFASRRSLPKLMLSDNASTYLAAPEELQNLFSFASLAENLSRRGVQWYFDLK